MHFPLVEQQFESELFEKGESVVVGVSGGADSMVLLELLSALARSMDLSLRAVHVNYGLRGEASQLDEYTVRRRCHELNIFLMVHRATELTAESANLEERAREIRHTVLRAEASEIGASAIALGHTLDDQAETILLRLLRGSGLRGLAAMRARDGIIVRPLLRVPRATIRQYARDRAIGYRDDQSNFDLKFARNRVRYQLLPLLREQFNPNIVATLVQSAELIGADERFMDDLAETLYRRFVKEKDDAVVVASTELTELPRALQRRLLRAMIRGTLSNAKSAQGSQGAQVSQGAEGAHPQKIGHVRAVELALDALAKNNNGVIFPLGEGLTLRRIKGSVSVTLQTVTHAKI